MPSHKPRIAIIGGGPAGLTAGVLLHKHGVPFTIFELRQKPTPEELAQPIGMLDLHEKSGLAAIRKCDLYNEFLPLTGDCASVMKISDKDGNIAYTHGDEGKNDRPEISRHALNQLLISKLPAEAIKWGHKLLSATSSARSGHTEVELDFGEHNKQIFDYVIGADGAWSKVRNLLTDAKPEYYGRQIITVSIKQITQKYPHLAELVGPGTFFAMGNRHGVVVQRGSQNSARMYIYFTTPDEQFGVSSGLASETAASVKTTMLRDNTLLGQWGPKIKELVTVACDEDLKNNPGEKVDIRPVYGLPIGYVWEHNPGATLIGDAAHLMPPSGGGVNLGMLDAVLLSQAIVKAHEIAGSDAVRFQMALNPLTREFESGMAVLAKKEAEKGNQLNGMLFAEDGVKAMTEFFEGVKQQL
ncbi:salicylate hydroxylase [Stipitochalara longipes BDJ]|nr:salicylate hydroxylase [Stipitochalara longipes BDJ]